jgi:hypothetical protein
MGTKTARRAGTDEPMKRLNDGKYKRFQAYHANFFALIIN